MKSFYVIIHDFNGRTFDKHDIMPYLLNEWKEHPISFYTDLYKKEISIDEWVNARLMNHYWARAQYEVILQPWPKQNYQKKIDIYWQCKMNMDLIVEIFKENIGWEK